MNADPQAQKLESRLLSMLRPGEMLRFVFVRDSSNRFALTLEGGGPEPHAFAQRIGMLLETSRRDGYTFCGEPTSETPVQEEPDNQHFWFELCPSERELYQLERAPLGFSSSTETSPRVAPQSISVPAFPASQGTGLADHPVDLLAEIPAVARLEIEFSHARLPDDRLDSVARALEQEIDLRREIRGTNFPASQMITFLGLWWSHRIGWQVRCRLLLEPGAEVPTGALEVLGNEIFGVESRLLEPSQQFRKTDGFSLTQSFPQGWSFPPLLPPRSRSGMLAAELLHNSHVPALPETGILIGRADSQDVKLPADARDRHVYIVGATGTGKTTLLNQLIRSDLRRNEGLVLLDPHGDLYKEVLRAIPKHRRRDLLTIDASGGEMPVSFNVLDFPKDRFLRRRAEFIVGEMLQFFRIAWPTGEVFGPVFETYFRNALRLMIHQNNKQLTLLDFERVFADREFRNELIAECEDESVCRFWSGLAERAGGEISLANVAPYITSKVSALPIHHTPDDYLKGDSVNLQYIFAGVLCAIFGNLDDLKRSRGGRQLIANSMDILSEAEAGASTKQIADNLKWLLIEGNSKLCVSSEPTFCEMLNAAVGTDDERKAVVMALRNVKTALFAPFKPDTNQWHSLPLRLLARNEAFKCPVLDLASEVRVNDSPVSYSTILAFLRDLVVALNSKTRYLTRLSLKTDSGVVLACEWSEAVAGSNRSMIDCVFVRKTVKRLIRFPREWRVESANYGDLSRPFIMLANKALGLNEAGGWVPASTSGDEVMALQKPDDTDGGRTRRFSISCAEERLTIRWIRI